MVGGFQLIRPPFLEVKRPFNALNLRRKYRKFVWFGMRFLGILRTKQDIATNCLPRCSGMHLDDFGSHILLINSWNYLENIAD